MGEKRALIRLLFVAIFGMMGIVSIAQNKADYQIKSNESVVYYAPDSGSGDTNTEDTRTKSSGDTDPSTAPGDTDC